MPDRLHPDDVEAIARRVVELTRETAAERPIPEGSLVDATEIARRFGVSRDWAYAHAKLLGAVRLGTGPRARLRFDLETVAEALGLAAAPTTDGEPTPERAAPRGRAKRRQETPSGAPLLPIRGQEA